MTRTPTIPRREFLKIGASVAGTAAITGSGLAQRAFANNHPQPHEDSIDFLDRETYISEMSVHSVFDAKTLGQHGIQMVARGDERFFFCDNDVIDVTDPLRPTHFAENAWAGGGAGGPPAIGYNRQLGKWIMIVGDSPPGTSVSEDQRGGKYQFPEKIDATLTHRGLRGCRIYDVSDPANISLLAEWSVDQGDPSRELQTGEGVFRIHYDGGKYAYMDAGPDDSFANMESPIHHHTRCLQIIDVEDPANPKFVSNWWVPGQRTSEREDYAAWREYGDRVSWTSSNGFFYVPQRVEDGGRYCYSTWGSFGFLIHDVSDPANPQLVSQFFRNQGAGSIDFFDCNLGWLDQGIAIAHGETLELDCAVPTHLPWILDVSDPANPIPLSQMPNPQPPPEAPYDDFCNKRGRYGVRHSSPLISPGTVDRPFFPITFFTGGLQCYDITDPRNPRINAYFVPPQAGDLDDYASYHRPVQNVYVEWDRRLIWTGTDTGLYALSSPHLGDPILEPMRVSEWTVPGIFEGYS